MPSLPILFEDQGGPGPGAGGQGDTSHWRLLVILLGQIEDPPVRSTASLSSGGWCFLNLMHPTETQREPFHWLIV